MNWMNPFVLFDDLSSSEVQKFKSETNVTYESNQCTKKRQNPDTTDTDFFCREEDK